MQSCHNLAFEKALSKIVYRLAAEPEMDSPEGNCTRPSSSTGFQSQRPERQFWNCSRNIASMSLPSKPKRSEACFRNSRPSPNANQSASKYRADAPRLLYVVTEDWYFLSHRLAMARAARDAGFEVHVATRIIDGGDQIAAEGFIAHDIPFVRGTISPFASLKTILALRKLLRKIEPSIAHHVSLQCTLLGSLAALGRPIAVVNAVTGFGYSFTAGSLRARLLRKTIAPILRLLFGRSHTIALVQNSDDRDELQSIGVEAERIALIAGSGVDTIALHPTPEPTAPITVAFVGRLLEDKGIRTLMDAHRLLRDRGAGIVLLIAGTIDPSNPTSVTGEEMEVWSQEPSLNWLGYVSNISEVWARAHIAVLPSRREGLPLSLLEAAACGRPMIATDVPGCREVVIDGKTGVLIPVDDPEALTAAIGNMAGSAALRARYGAAARELAITQFFPLKR